MAFKSIKQYNDEKYKDLFILRNDKDSADVVFLYRDYNDVLVADAHYIKSDEYSGYVHCCGKGCPACNREKPIKIQQKLFIPVYNIGHDAIEFWDRSIRFETQLNEDVFKNYPDPCKYVFRITRAGVANDVNTEYRIQVIGKNTAYPYEEILAKFNAAMPDYYEHVCREVSIDQLNNMLTNSTYSAAAVDDLPSYQVTPRGAASAQPTSAELPADTVEANMIPETDTNPIDSDEDVDNVTF